MAYKPSMRSKNEPLDIELDIRPVMNLMVVLIPLLIASAEWVKLGIIEINVPPAKNVSAGGGQGEQNDEEKDLRLGLKIAIANDGISIANAQTILGGEEEEGPTVPMTEDESYDYAKLKGKLIEIKEAIKGKGFKDANRAVITASKNIEYQVIIDVMDNIQTYEKDDQILPLFPEVNFGSIIQ
ncbi:MAG: hypothetical protein GF313_14760 [Caldithrix sp.]|nr:hypothetical protein [Caldithrix sp.]